MARAHNRLYPDRSRRVVKRSRRGLRRVLVRCRRRGSERKVFRLCPEVLDCLILVISKRSFRKALALPTKLVPTSEHSNELPAVAK